MFVYSWAFKYPHTEIQLPAQMCTQHTHTHRCEGVITNNKHIPSFLLVALEMAFAIWKMVDILSPENQPSLESWKYAISPVTFYVIC